MMPMSVKQIFATIFTATLLVGCSGEDSLFIPNVATPVSFSPRVDNVAMRAESVFTDSFADFSVYATVNSDRPYLLMKDEHIYKDQSNKWQYDNHKYWPLNETVSFFAYAPYQEENVSFSYPDKNIVCIIPADPDKQFDLMVAQALEKSAADQSVGLLFRHLLSRIDFTVNATDNENNVKINLNSFQLVVNENTLSNNGVYNMATDTWKINNNSFMSGGRYNLAKDAINISAKEWMYSMMLLPQKHDAGYMRVNIFYSILSGDTVLASKEISVDLASIACEKGKKYTYNFKITPKGVTLEIDISPWNTGGWESDLFPDNP